MTGHRYLTHLFQFDLMFVILWVSTMNCRGNWEFIWNVYLVSFIYTPRFTWKLTFMVWNLFKNIWESSKKIAIEKISKCFETHAGLPNMSKFLAWALIWAFAEIGSKWLEKWSDLIFTFYSFNPSRLFLILLLMYIILKNVL